MEDSDLDFSFTSTTTTATSSSSILSSSARSSLALSFNGRLSTTTTPTSTSTTTIRPHRSSDPNWSAVKTATTLSSTGALDLRHLKLLRLVGSGNLGRVFHCRLRDYEYSNFALKVIDRDSITAKKLSHVQTEAEILSVLDHPFLPTLYARIDVSHYTCLLIDYCPNGDLHSLLRKQPNYRLPIQSVRFYAAEILLALEYLHSLGIVYRDLKPENVLIREDGHIMLSDFDLCFRSDVEPKLVNRAPTRKIPNKDNKNKNCFYYNRQPDREADGFVTEFISEPIGAFSKSCVGTHEYLAPELLTGNGHGNGVDWWAFGVLIYELIYGSTPFKGSSKETTLRNIASTKDVKFVEGSNGEDEAKDLIEKLLVKDPRRRLGCTRGATDIKSHPFFNGIKWPLIRMYRPPEVRGIVVSKAKSYHVSYSKGSGVFPIRRRWWWKGLDCVLRRNKGSKRNLNCNYNYYCYSSNGNSNFRKSR